MMRKMIMKGHYIKNDGYPEREDYYLVQDIYGHYFVGEFCKKILVNAETGQEMENVFISSLTGEVLPNPIKKWSEIEIYD